MWPCLSVGPLAYPEASVDHADELAEVDEELRHAQAVPEGERGAAWGRYVDGLLDKRARLARTEFAARETRVVRFSEAR